MRFDGTPLLGELNGACPVDDTYILLAILLMQGIGTAPNGIGLLKRIISVAQKVLCGNDSKVEAKSTVYSKTYNEYCLNNSSD